MTDKHAISIILIITFIVLVIIGCRNEDSFYFVLAYFDVFGLLLLWGKLISRRLDKIEQKENSKPL